MAMTKVEAAKLTQDMMLRGVIETIVTESMILELLPFMEVRDTVRGDRINLVGSPSARCLDPSPPGDGRSGPGERDPQVRR